jgi:GH15 family glucan-1,4-alpha-glucosidase
MPPIKDYYIIGDLYSAALVSKTGSIDWLCLPHFDSPSIFARSLDEHGGQFGIKTDKSETETTYIPETAIVEHTTETMTIRDYMVPQEVQDCHNHYLVRKCIAHSHNASITFLFDPKPNYARVQPEIDQQKNLLILSVGNDQLILHMPEQTSIKQTDKGYELSCQLKKGDSCSFVLEYRDANATTGCAGQDWEKEVRLYWKNWVSKGTYIDFCRHQLVRSAITLKLMQFYPTGAFVAAPTTSLPEDIGGYRNWDYRYVWIRDATFTLYALYVLDYTEEAEKFFQFIHHITQHCTDEDYDIKLMYTIWGEEVPEEETLDHLTGYQDSRPVRIGNSAADQFQLDIYGSLIDAHYFVSKRGIKINTDNRKQIMNLVRRIERMWHEKDNGIWEIRVGLQHYTYSKVMAWVGTNRARRLKDKLHLSQEEDTLCENLENSISDWIWEHCYDKNSRTFRQYPTTSDQDATNLLFVLLQFLDKHDPRTSSVIHQTYRELKETDIFVYRYIAEDGLEGEEGAFLLCSFWLISALAIIGETDQAKKLFTKLESQFTPHGLLPEEVDPRSGDYVGNYPQAFSHVGYIMTAYYLDRYE